MKLFSANNLANIIFALAIAASAFAMARPLFLMSSEKRAGYVANQNAIAVNSALTAYSQKHGGSFPGGGAIAGGVGDVLTREKILLSYPENPFSRGTKMKKVPFGKPSPGDFSYTRDSEKEYQYRFVVYGRRGKMFDYGTK
jgi:hypothetical protein